MKSQLEEGSSRIISFAAKCFVATCLAAAPCFAELPPEVPRGNDFGNGGDPVREVVYAARFFTRDLYEALTPKSLTTAGLDQGLIATYSLRREALKNYLLNVAFNWDDFPDLTTCARFSKERRRTIDWSNEHCPQQVPNAFEGVQRLLQLSSEAILDKSEQSDAPKLAKLLFEFWKEAFKEQAKSARENFSVSKPSLAGIWQCGNKGHAVKINKDALVQGLLGIEGYAAKFVDFALTLNAARTAFQAQGEIELKRAQPVGETENVVAEGTCNYAVIAMMERSPELDDGDLIVRLSSDGIPKNAGCAKLKAKDGKQLKAELLCQRKD